MNEDAQTHIDTRAVEIASRALERITQHEKACDERMSYIRAGQERIEKNIKEGFSEAHTRIDGVAKTVSGNRAEGLTRMLMVAGVAISVLLGLSGYLFARSLGWF